MAELDRSATLRSRVMAMTPGGERCVNLIVGTTNNDAPIHMAVKEAAQSLIDKGTVGTEGLNRVEMAFRAFDPCMACATQSLPGRMPLEVVIRNPDGTERQRLTQCLR